MTIRPSVPEIITVNSEALQSEIRDLLPSQNGFGSELQASNVITPIIDLTPTAQGSVLPGYLQTAIAFGSQTAFNITNTTSVIVNTTGFFRIFGTASIYMDGSLQGGCSFSMTDGSSTKTIWSAVSGSTGTAYFNNVPFDFTVFLAAGESISGTSINGAQFLTGSSRQIADIQGTFVNPAGFTSE